MRILGLDPGLRHTGWAVIDVKGSRLSPVAAGVVNTDGAAPLAKRLVELYEGLEEVIETFAPEQAAVEETFINKNPTSTLKLGLARGVALLVPARAGLDVAEYPANLVKKSVVGAGHATKEQIQAMIRVLLPGMKVSSADAADACAVAVTHAHHGATRARLGGIMAGGSR
ncbi:MAG: crossover junction endodeoxyribonuclease RuvC [Pseudomonadota bacterium]|nr:crossover junction endodeoxyribonuclease RuvC [Pseudomonadota bacterium]